MTVESASIGNRAASDALRKLSERNIEQTRVTVLLRYTFDNGLTATRHCWEIPVSVADCEYWVASFVDSFYEYDVVPYCGLRGEIPHPEKVWYGVYFSGDMIPELGIKAL